MPQILIELMFYGPYIKPLWPTLSHIAEPNSQALLDRGGLKYLDSVYPGLGFRVLGFRGLGFRGLGFRGLGFSGLGFRVYLVWTSKGNHTTEPLCQTAPLNNTHLQTPCFQALVEEAIKPRALP